LKENATANAATVTKLKGDLSFASTKEQASLTRARMAEKEANDLKKQVAALTIEIDALKKA